MLRAFLLGLLLIIIIAGVRVYQNATNEPAAPSTEQTSNNAQTSVVADTPIYLDVRTQEEWNQGHVANAVHWDLVELEQGHFPELDKNAKILIYCRSGNRAGTALQILQKQGYANLTNAGAFSNLQSSGIKTCSGPDANCS